MDPSKVPSFVTRVPALLTTVFALACSVTGAAAQSSPVSVEVRVGGAMGSYEPAAAEANWGQKPAVALGIGYRLSPRITAVAGYSRASFGCEGGFCRDAEIDFYSRGWDAGLQLGGMRGLWVRGGGVLHTFDIPATTTGEPRLISDRALGAHLSAGYGLGIGSRLALSPGIRYTRYSARFEDDPASDRVDYLVADLGLIVRF